MTALRERFDGRRRRLCLWAVLLLLLVLLQHRLWLGPTGYTYGAQLRQQIAEQRRINDGLQRRNGELVVEVKELQQGDEGLEEKAREDMGMVRRDETYFLYLPYE